MNANGTQVAHLIRQAEDLMDRGEWDEVAELCYQALTLDPDNANAANKLRLVYLQKDLGREMAKQMLRLFDPEDDRPHQRRHKLGFSYCCLSRWPGWYDPDWDTPPTRVSNVLETGRGHLIGDYLLGEEGAYAAAHLRGGVGDGRYARGSGSDSLVAGSGLRPLRLFCRGGPDHRRDAGCHAG